MKKTLITILILTITFSYSQDSDWVDLFDGKTLNGWHKYNGDKTDAWYVENSELILDSKNNNASGGNDIVTDKKYTNFELSIEWNIPKGGNSGIMYGVEEIEGVDAPWKTGPEIQVLDNRNFAGGGSHRIHRAPALYGLKPIGKVKYNSYGNWNHLILKIDHDNNTGSITFNGEFVYSFPLSGPEWDKLVSRSKFSDDEYFKDLKPSHPFFTYAPYFGKFKTGKIALQDHGYSVRYRNIKIREF